MTAGIGASASSHARRLLQLARVVFTPVSLAVIAWFIWINREELAGIVTGSNGAWLFASFLIWTGSHLVSPLIGVSLFSACGIRMSYNSCLHIHCSRLPAKYIPGGIWHSVGRANDYLLLGHAHGKVATFFMLENLLLVGVTFAMSAPFVSRLLTAPELQALLLAGTVLAALAIALAPLLLRVLSRGRLTIAWRGYLLAVPSLVLYWCVVGLSFTSYIAAFSELSLQGSNLETVAVYVFSWCMGYLAIFAPQGVGIMEFVSGYLLAAGEGLKLVGLIAGFRLVILSADICTWLISGLAGEKQ